MSLETKRRGAREFWNADNIKYVSHTSGSKTGLTISKPVPVNKDGFEDIKKFWDAAVMPGGECDQSLPNTPFLMDTPTPSPIQPKKSEGSPFNAEIGTKMEIEDEVLYESPKIEKTPLPIRSPLSVNPSRQTPFTFKSRIPQNNPQTLNVPSVNRIRGNNIEKDISLFNSFANKLPSETATLPIIRTPTINPINKKPIINNIDYTPEKTDIATKTDTPYVRTQQKEVEKGDQFFEGNRYIPSDSPVRNHLPLTHQLKTIKRSPIRHKSPPSSSGSETNSPERSILKRNIRKTKKKKSTSSLIDDIKPKYKQHEELYNFYSFDQSPIKAPSTFMGKKRTTDKNIFKAFIDAPSAISKRRHIHDDEDRIDDEIIPIMPKKNVKREVETFDFDGDASFDDQIVPPSHFNIFNKGIKHDNPKKEKNEQVIRRKRSPLNVYRRDNSSSSDSSDSDNNNDFDESEKDNSEKSFLSEQIDVNNENQKQKKVKKESFFDVNDNEEINSLEEQIEPEEDEEEKEDIPIKPILKKRQSFLKSRPKSEKKVVEKFKEDEKETFFSPKEETHNIEEEKIEDNFVEVKEEQVSEKIPETKNSYNLPPSTPKFKMPSLSVPEEREEPKTIRIQAFNKVNDKKPSSSSDDDDNNKNTIDGNAFFGIPANDSPTKSYSPKIKTRMATTTLDMSSSSSDDDNDDEKEPAHNSNLINTALVKKELKGIDLPKTPESKYTHKEKERVIIKATETPFTKKVNSALDKIKLHSTVSKSPKFRVSPYSSLRKANISLLTQSDDDDSSSSSIELSSENSDAPNVNIRNVPKQINDLDDDFSFGSVFDDDETNTNIPANGSPIDDEPSFSIPSDPEDEQKAEEVMTAKKKFDFSSDSDTPVLNISGGEIQDNDSLISMKGLEDPEIKSDTKKSSTVQRTEVVSKSGKTVSKGPLRKKRTFDQAYVPQFGPGFGTVYEYGTKFSSLLLPKNKLVENISIKPGKEYSFQPRTLETIAIIGRGKGKVTCDDDFDKDGEKKVFSVTAGGHSSHLRSHHYTIENADDELDLIVHLIAV